LSCNTQIINGLITVANVQLQRFQPLQTAILTVAKCLFSCSERGNEIRRDGKKWSKMKIGKKRRAEFQGF
jgi:hypothetical protein